MHSDPSERVPSERVPFERVAFGRVAFGRVASSGMITIRIKIPHRTGAQHERLSTSSSGATRSASRRNLLLVQSSDMLLRDGVGEITCAPPTLTRTDRLRAKAGGTLCAVHCMQYTVRSTTIPYLNLHHHYRHLRAPYTNCCES